MCASLSAAQAQPELVLHSYSNLWQPAPPSALFCCAVCKHAGANNVQRCWDATPPPPGVLVIGDGVQALNPVYAQGMSVAAKSAECLSRVMQASVDGKASLEARRQAVRGMGPSFHKQLAAVVAPAWMMATSEDQRCVWLWAVRMVVLIMHAATLVPSLTQAGCWVCQSSAPDMCAIPGIVLAAWPAFTAPESMLCVLSASACCSLRCRYPGTKVEGVAKPPRLLCLYIDALVKSCHHNAAVLMGFFEVAHLVRPPTHLFHPRMLAAVSWGWRCGCGYGRPAMAENGHVLGTANGRQLQAPV